ncbi:MAG: TOMM precursor leader peptide-binding protein [Bauldia sp.]|uniref:TOMM precursor leader peptide-binding protein n=1 Tax=Bauldia sp. TaxID=2575872 RepID=UPI001D80A766|nr:TOMM precursor leader peptide-binding protein [Bauldia sp.]MCB1497410.1 TOMM precursor leader peptide-binding protein [Bauldia sp.]
MDDGIPGITEARYRLLGLQAVRHDGGVVIRRGKTRLEVPGEKAGDLLDLLVARSAEGSGIDLEEIQGAIDATDHELLRLLVERLRSARLLVRGGDIGGERRDDIFYWNHGTTAAATAANITSIDLAVFGINHVSLPLLGNLRSCGFRRLTLVDHPALRNLDFFDEDRKLRSEIAGAMSVRPRSFEEWQGRGRPSECQVVCSDVGGLGLMRDWNRSCVAANVPFYPIVLEDEVAHLGPLVIPGEGPCFECLCLRREAAAADPDRERATQGHAFFGRVVSGYLQPMARVAADIAAIELLKFFSRTLPGGAAGRLIEADLMVPALRTRTVLKVPRCPVCATAASGSAPAPDEPEAGEA